MKRRLLWALGGFTVVLVVAGLTLRARIARLDAEALRLAETGKASIALLNALRDGLEGRNPAAVAALYEASVSADTPADWRTADATSRDGIDTRRWQPGAQDIRSPTELAGGWLTWLGEVDRIDLFKIKLGRIVTYTSRDGGGSDGGGSDGGGSDGKNAYASSRGAVINAVLWLRAQVGELRRESRMQLQMHVRGPAGGGPGSWRISAQRLLDGETVEGHGTGFVDVAQAAGIGFQPEHNPHFATEAWAPRRFEMIRYGSAGVSAVDYDGDGWDDVFYANGGRSHLYRNLGDGSFEDATAAARLPADLVGVNVALFVDLDNDGDRDLFCGIFTGENRLFRNDGDGGFSEVTEGAGLGGELVVVAAAGDYDGDGLIDLYAGRYLDPRIDLPTTLFYTRNGAANSLLRNRGNLRFEDVTESSGTGEVGLSLGVAFADYDSDGDQDLYVANDFGRNALLRNDGDDGPSGTTFTDVSAASEALDFGFGMSATWADLDNDRDFDLYVSNVHSGQRWYGQAATLHKYLLTSIRQQTIREDFPLYREIFSYAGDEWYTYGDRMTKGNSLLINDGGHFADVAEAAGANPFGWYWGAAVFDFDHDGWLDVYGANGWISGETYDDL